MIPANDTDVLVVDFDFGGWRRTVWPLWDSCGGASQEGDTYNHKPARHAASNGVLAAISGHIGYCSTAYTITLASSMAASCDSGTGGVRTMCFGTIA